MLARARVPPPTESPAEAARTVSDLGLEYLKVLAERRRLAQRTLEEYRAAHALLPFVLGEDKPVAGLTNADLERFYSGLARLPASRKAYPKYRDPAFEELSRMTIPREACLDTATRNAIFSRIKTEDFADEVWI